MEFREIAQHLDPFGGPLVATVAIYALFKFLDTKASDAAKRVIMTWIKAEPYKRLDLEAAVVQAFDNLYGTPLFSRRSFERSAYISILASCVYLAFMDKQLYWIIEYYSNFKALSIIIFNYLFIISLLAVPIIATDYVSLFIVRRCLVMGREDNDVDILTSITLALITAFGAFTAAAFVLGGLGYAETIAATGERAIPELGLVLRLVLPALLVHLWLPLLLLAATIMGALNAFFQAVGWAQWFIKRGDAHPFEALGMVASVVVFIGAVAWQGVSYLVTPQS